MGNNNFETNFYISKEEKSALIAKHGKVPMLYDFYNKNHDRLPPLTSVFAKKCNNLSELSIENRYKIFEIIMALPSKEGMHRYLINLPKQPTDIREEMKDILLGKEYYNEEFVEISTRIVSGTIENILKAFAKHGITFELNQEFQEASQTLQLTA